MGDNQEGARYRLVRWEYIAIVLLLITACVVDTYAPMLIEQLTEDLLRRTYYAD